MNDRNDDRTLIERLRWGSQSLLGYVQILRENGERVARRLQLQVIGGELRTEHDRTVLVIPPGRDGKPGADGAHGATGEKGDRGDRGDVGLSGERDSPGGVGPRGERGLAGPPGPQSAAGLPGPRGEAGLAGSTGPAGERGERGAIGPQGVAGAAGAPGERGPGGRRGMSGEEGARGATGATGAAGDGANQFVQPFSDSDEVVVNHNFGRYPAAVSVRTEGGTVVECEIHHISNNQLRIYFAVPLSGVVTAM